MRATGQDTIAAIATPPGAGALGIIRVSGPNALDIVRTLVAGADKPLGQDTHTVRRVRLVDRERGQPIDDALCTVMRAPGSYTGEDVVELSCHGNPVVLALVLERLRRAGARHAEPGEFTRRAFVNGRVDLARAEAVALMIEARSERAVLAAARAMSGALSRQLAQLRHDLLDVIAGLEVGLDFPDDEVGLTMADACARVVSLADRAAHMERASRRGRRVHDGLTVAIVGRTNAGKSSLFNALVGRNRAIVSPAPGTTRDVIEATVELDGVAVRLLDTAGLGIPHDAVEAEGMVRTRAAIDESDLVLWVHDGSVPSDGSVVDTGDRPVIAVRSKADLSAHPLALPHPDAVGASTTTPDGIEALLTALRREVVRLVVFDEDDEGPLAASLRQAEKLGALAHALLAAVSALESTSADAALVDLHESLVIASGLLGVDVGDDVLDRIFSSFCVGK
jgi:tRNA modification GTPase